jgi:hypothetical protein
VTREDAGMTRLSVVLVCAECGRESAAGAKSWRAYLTCDDPPAVAFFCPSCAKREFDDGLSESR